VIEPELPSTTIIYKREQREGSGQSLEKQQSMKVPKAKKKTNTMILK
jgi:hypothetical protein